MIDVARDFERMQDYIVGRMSDEEQRAFEERLVRDPALVLEVERSLRLREGLQQLKIEDYRAHAEQAQARLRVWVPLLAAAGVAGLALLAWVEQPRVTASPLLTAALESTRASGGTSAVTAHFTFIATRAVSAPALNLPASGLVEFRAAPTTRLTGTPYRATLMRGDGPASPQPIASVTGLGLETDGYIHLYAAAARLGSGRYSLQIEHGRGQPEERDAFAFSLRAAGAPSAH